MRSVRFARRVRNHVPEFVSVAKVGDVAPGSGTVVDAGGRRLALFNVDGRFYALDNTCLHRGGPVGEGDLDGRVVTCPWHGWQYDVTTGRNVFDSEIGLQTYDVLIVDGEIRVGIEPAGED
jgi:nitrite reductase (NADH) small subunit/3-phenylpropionate/trans-cinnamate dioxygenase ferredoxin subunit